MNIIMGNDEFILYIRKSVRNCNKTNDQLGKKIWEWLRKNGASVKEEDKQCLWNYSSNALPDCLPKTACQFEFDRSILPDLYFFLDKLISDCKKLK